MPGERSSKRDKVRSAKLDGRDVRIAGFSPCAPALIECVSGPAAGKQLLLPASWDSGAFAVNERLRKVSRRSMQANCVVLASSAGGTVSIRALNKNTDVWVLAGTIAGGSGVVCVDSHVGMVRVHGHELSIERRAPTEDTPGDARAPAIAYGLDEDGSSSDGTGNAHSPGLRAARAPLMPQQHRYGGGGALLELGRRCGGLLRPGARDQFVSSCTRAGSSDDPRFVHGRGEGIDDGTMSVWGMQLEALEGGQRCVVETAPPTNDCSPTPLIPSHAANHVSATSLGNGPSETEPACASTATSPPALTSSHARGQTRRTRFRETSTVITEVIKQSSEAVDRREGVGSAIEQSTNHHHRHQSDHREGVDEHRPRTTPSTGAGAAGAAGADGAGGMMNDWFSVCSASDVDAPQTAKRVVEEQVALKRIPVCCALMTLHDNSAVPQVHAMFAPIPISPCLCPPPHPHLPMSVPTSPDAWLHDYVLPSRHVWLPVVAGSAPSAARQPERWHQRRTGGRATARADNEHSHDRRFHRRGGVLERWTDGLAFPARALCRRGVRRWCPAPY